MKFRNLFIFVLLLVISCSTVKFAYDKLYYIAYQKVDDYFDLNSDQVDFVKSSFQNYFIWVKRSELKKYKRLLVDVKNNTDNMSMADMERFNKIIKNYFDISLNKLEPSIVSFLRTVDDSQITYYENYLKENRDEKRMDQFKKTDKDYYQIKYDSLYKRLEEYFGELSDSQKKKVRKIFSYDKRRAQIIFYDDLRSRQRFLKILKNYRKDSDFDKKISNVLRSGNLLFTAEEKKRREAYHRRNLVRMYELFQILTPEQQSHFKSKIDEYIDIIDSILSK